MMASSTGSTLGRQITRSRVSYSCHACRRRKVRCDKIRPICSNCRKSKDRCSYDAAESLMPGQEIRTRSKRQRINASGGESRHAAEASGSSGDDSGQDTGATTAPQIPHEIEARLDRLTALVERLSRNENPRHSQQARSPAPEGPQATHSQISLRSSQGNVSSTGVAQSPGIDGTADNTSNSEDSDQDDNSISEQPAPPYDETHNGVGDLALGHLSLQEGYRSRYVGNTHWGYIASEIAELNQLLRDQTRYNAPDVMSPGSTDPRSPNALGKDTMMPISSLLVNNGLHNFDETEADHLSPDTAANTTSRLRSSRSPSPSRFAVLNEEMFDGLPPKRQCHILYRCYISGVHGVFPLAHLPTLLQWYDDFWSWHDNRYSTMTPYPYPAFISLLYAILFGGSVSCSRYVFDAEFAGESRSSVSSRLSDHAIRSLSQLSFLRSPTLPGLMAFLIIHTLLCREEEPLVGSLSFSLALRMAEIMGLHREPASFDIEPHHAEARRRVWWHIVWMDSLVSNATGWPPLVMSRKYWDVNHVSELKDRLVGTGEGYRYLDATKTHNKRPEKPDSPFEDDYSSHVSVWYIAIQGKYLMTECARKMTEIQLGVTPIGAKEFQAMQALVRPVEEDFRKRMKRILNPHVTMDSLYGKDHVYTATGPAPYPESLIQPWKGIIPEEDLNPQKIEYHTKIMIVYHKWARIMLILLVDKAYCLLYQPFVKHPKSKTWDRIRVTALKYCHNYMKNFLELATNPIYQPFQWAWPGGHQPMHAVMMMLADLYERPFSDEANQSRAYVDKTFKHASIEGGVITEEAGVPVQRPLREGGQEAWQMIRRLREKAWLKAGLDPHIVWYEQDRGSSREAALGKSSEQGGRGSTGLVASAPLYASSSGPSSEPSRSTRPAPGPGRTGSMSQALGTCSQMLSQPSATYVGSSVSTPMVLENHQAALDPRSLNQPDPRQLNVPHYFPVNATMAPLPMSAFPNFTNPMTFVSGSSWQESPTVTASSVPPTLVVGDHFTPSMDADGQDFNWDQWDSMFRHYAPMEDEDMNIDEGGSGFE